MGVVAPGEKKIIGESSSYLLKDGHEVHVNSIGESSSYLLKDGHEVHVNSIGESSSYLLKNSFVIETKNCYVA